MGKVLVTGGAGFIGSHLVDRLLSVGERVVVLDAMTAPADRERLERAIRRGARFHEGSVGSAATVRAAMTDCDRVYHLAAESHVAQSFQRPDVFRRTNVEGTRKVLEAARDLRVARVVHMSTDEVYGPATIARDETGAFAPTSPYARSKAEAEHVCSDFRELGLDIRILRPTNAVGAGQDETKMLPRFVARAMAGQRIEIEGTGRQTRRWLPVGCLVRAARLVMEADRPNGTFNVGGEEDHAVLDVARMVVETLGCDVEIAHVSDRPVQDMGYAVDDRRLRALGWRQRGRLEDAIVALAQERGWVPLSHDLRSLLPQRVNAATLEPAETGDWAEHEREDAA